MSWLRCSETTQTWQNWMKSKIRQCLWLKWSSRVLISICSLRGSSRSKLVRISRTWTTTIFSGDLITSLFCRLKVVETPTWSTSLLLKRIPSNSPWGASNCGQRIEGCTQTSWAILVVWPGPCWLLKFASTILTCQFATYLRPFSSFTQSTNGVHKTQYCYAPCKKETWLSSPWMTTCFEIGTKPKCPSSRLRFPTATLASIFKTQPKQWFWQNSKKAPWLLKLLTQDSQWGGNACLKNFLFLKLTNILFKSRFCLRLCRTTNDGSGSLSRRWRRLYSYWRTTTLESCKACLNFEPTLRLTK